MPTNSANSAAFNLRLYRHGLTSSATPPLSMASPASSCSFELPTAICQYALALTAASAHGDEAPAAVMRRSNELHGAPNCWKRQEHGHLLILDGLCARVQQLMPPL